MTALKARHLLVLQRAAQERAHKQPTPQQAETAVHAHLANLTHQRALRDQKNDASYQQIPRFFQKRTVAAAATTNHQGNLDHAAAVATPAALLNHDLSRLAQSALREHMATQVLEQAELDACWHALRAAVSPPASPTDERINYDGFCQVAEQMPARAAKLFFLPSHFLQFTLDEFGRVSILHFFQWVRCKNAILRTRVELSRYVSNADGSLTERDLEHWVSDLLPQLPSLRELQGERHEFAPFYKVTAVRKFFFFLDQKQRGRISLQDLLSSAILHELLELRRPDVTRDELRQNWFSLDYAEMLYSDYLDLDADQNGMLSAQELRHFIGGAAPGGGLTLPFVQRVFQEYQTYRNKETGQSEIDYKAYLEFVLAFSYKSSPEALIYFFRLLDLRRLGGLTTFEISYFFRAVIEKFYEIGEEPNVRVEDVQNEIFDMVKPADPNVITLKDLIECKVGDTVVGMLTDAYAFYLYDRREEILPPDDPALM